MNPVSKMNLPSAKQAQAYWLAAAGMSAVQISEVMNCNPGCAQGYINQARKKATEIGLTYKIIPKPESPKVGSGMLHLKQLALEAGLYESK